MAKYEGFRPQWMRVDEASNPLTEGELDAQQQALRRQLGDDWDVTSAGVLLQPIPIGTTVEAYDNRREWYAIGQVTQRAVRPDGTGSRISIYNIRCEYGEIGASREYISVFDKSPEGIERWLDDGDARPRTAEEIERWLGEDA